MTTPPQKEYIITEKQLLDLEEMYDTEYEVSFLVATSLIRSRPIPSPKENPIRSYCKHPDAGTRRSCAGLCRGPGSADDCEFFQHELSQAAHDTAIRKQERERVLGRIESHIQSKHMISSGCDGHKLWIWSEPILDLIESLRGEP